MSSADILASAELLWIKDKKIVECTGDMCNHTFSLRDRRGRFLDEDRGHQMTGVVRQGDNAYVVCCSTDRSRLVRNFCVGRENDDQQRTFVLFQTR